MNGFWWAAIGIVAVIAVYGAGFIHGVKAGWAWREENQPKQKK